MQVSPRIIVPLLLAVAGIILLIGCIPVPATRQFQPDWKLRPEHVIGNSPDKPVRIGSTRIDAAFIELSRRTGGINPPWSIMNWIVSRDQRRFAVAYQVRTTTDIYPLCFFAQERTEQRWLTLDVDDVGIVTGATTTTQEPPGLQRLLPDQWLKVFDESQRQKLQAAGVFPADDILRQAGEAQRSAQQQVQQQRPQRKQPQSQAPGQRYPTNAPAEEFWK